MGHAHTTGGGWMEEVLDGLPDAVVVVDDAWRCTYANMAAQEGARGALLGQVVWELAPQLRDGPFHGACVRARATREPVTVRDVRYECGSSAGWFDCAVRPLRQGVVMSFRDAGERRRADEALRRAREALARAEAALAAGHPAPTALAGGLSGSGAAGAPRSAPPAAPEPTTPPPSSAPGGPRRILLADDDPTNVDTVVDYLRMKGHEVHVARDGREALKVAADIRPEVIIMDVHMPVLDGLSATRILRDCDEPTLRGVPVIAVTAMAMTGDRERCLAAGATEYLSKPVGLKRLSALIAAVTDADTRS